MMKIACPVLLPDTLMETASPESPRCLRRIFFLAHHSRNPAAPSNRVSGTRLNRRSPPASGSSCAQAVCYQLKTTNRKERNDNHENTSYLSEFTSHDSPFSVHSHSRRAYAWCVCACPEGGSGKSAARRRLSQPQHCRGGFCAL